MRLILQLSKNTSLVPFDHLPSLVGAFHKWAGVNNLVHDEVSLYSFSWLKGGKAVSGKGLHFPSGAQWMIGVYDPQLLKTVIQGILEDPVINFGLTVRDVTLQEAPHFGTEKIFSVASPVLVKKKREDGSIHHCLYHETESDGLLTRVLQTKLRAAGLKDESASVSFYRDYPVPKTHKINYKNIESKASTCPVLITGKPETLAFAWDVGVGHSTGIGFGALY
jgi:CRISPR-associated endoribonuclease Cas6